MSEPVEVDLLFPSDIPELVPDAAIDLELIEPINVIVGSSLNNQVTPLVGHNALRAVETTTLTVQNAMRSVLTQVGGLWTSSQWFLIAGTDVDDDNVVIRPDDYATTTNEKIWVKVAGL